MFGHRHLRPLWLLGLLILCAAQGVHAYEHWEIVANSDCVAHAHDHDDHDDSETKHQHGCTSHDHAPALAGAIFTLTVCFSVEPFMQERFDAPTPPAFPILHPPRLS